MMDFRVAANQVILGAAISACGKGEQTQEPGTQTTKALLFFWMVSEGEIDKAPLRRGYRCRYIDIDIDSYSGCLKRIS